MKKRVVCLRMIPIVSSLFCFFLVENAFYMSPEVSKNCKWFQSDQPFKNPFTSPQQREYGSSCFTVAVVE